MANSKELEELANRCKALAEAQMGWKVRETPSGHYVQGPNGDATTIPYKNGGRTLPNVQAKLSRMGLERSEEALARRRNQPAAPAPAARRPTGPVPVAAFQAPEPATTPALQESKSTPSAAAMKEAVKPMLQSVPSTPGGHAPNEKPIPYEEIESRIKDFFEVPMTLRPGGGPQRNYKRIQGLKMGDGTERFFCTDNPSCNDTYSTVYAARDHLGHAHPSSSTLARRAARAETQEPTPAPKKVSPPTTLSPRTSPAPSRDKAVVAPARAMPAERHPAPSPAEMRKPTQAATPAVMPRKMAPTLVRPEVPERPQQPAIPRPPVPPALAPSAVPNHAAVQGFVEGLGEFMTAYNHYRAVAEAGVGPWQQRAEAAERRAEEAEGRAYDAEARAAKKEELLRHAEQALAEETRRADEAEAKLEKMRKAAAALASLNAA